MTRRPQTLEARGFTLIELLVVVALIAMLIAILIPALSSARKSARTTLCLSRISQFGKSFGVYAEDYNEVFPFVATLHGTVLDANEAWLAEPNALPIIAHTLQEQWPTWVSVPKSGTLFPYARFEHLYRCPEFERISDPRKSQNVWNYTRAVWARYWRLFVELGQASASQWGDVSGPIMKTSKVHNPGALPMILDEQWDRHVATAGCFGDNNSAYNCSDYGFFADNIIGVYHGPRTVSRAHNFDHDPQPNRYVPFRWPRGSIHCYDGHAELERDPWPTFELGNNTRLAPKEFRLKAAGGRWWHEINGIKEYMKGLLYAQRGFTVETREIQPWGS